MRQIVDRASTFPVTIGDPAFLKAIDGWSRVAAKRGEPRFDSLLLNEMEIPRDALG